MDVNIILGPHKFSLQATVINKLLLSTLRKTFYCNSDRIAAYEIIDSK